MVCMTEYGALCSDLWCSWWASRIMFQLIYRKYGKGIRWKDDLLAGLTVSLALVPEAVAFAFVAGVDPLVGLYAAFIVGLITATIGGRPGMISGATGAMAVAMTAMVYPLRA